MQDVNSTLLTKLAALEPTPSFMGGYAEDALLAGIVRRPHEDVDLIFPRDQQDLRLAQLSELGFTDWETWGGPPRGVPFYLFGQNGDLKLDLGITDEADGHRSGCASTSWRSPSAARRRPPAIGCAFPTTSSTIRW